MPGLHLEPYAPASAREWDDLVARADAGTFLHTRGYLAHQGERFADRSLLVRAGAGGRLLAVLPAATDPEDPRTVVSHPGLTYGGLLTGRLDGADVEEALALAAERLAADGHARLVYRAVPHMYHRRPVQDDLLALHRLGARLLRRDLSATVDLAAGARPSEARRRALRRARQAGIGVSTDAAHLGPFHALLQARLAERHGVGPVHSLVELAELHSRFGASGQVALVVALAGDRVVAGALLYRTPRVHHAQYIASGAGGDAAGALDAVFDHAIAAAARAGVRYFDFGISSLDQTGAINPGLHRFKRGFGAGEVVLDRYLLDLA